MSPQSTPYYRMLIRKSYRFRLKINSRIEVSFRRFAGCTRFVWNRFLAKQIELLDRGEFILPFVENSRILTNLKNQEEAAFLKQAPAQILQQKLRDLTQAFSDYFDKNQPNRKFPRFKKKGIRDSFRYPQSFHIKGNHIYLPKIGWVRFYKSRKIEGKPKNITVSRSGVHWFVAIQTELEVPEPIHPSKNIVGIDMGIARFATLSDGTFIKPLNSFRKLERRLAQEQRSLSRKMKGSKNWFKQKHKVSKLYIKIANTRKDFLHKASTEISKNHAMIFIEDLRVSNMSKSARGTLAKPGKNIKAKSGLNKAILDQGWFEFRRQLEYKQAWRGGKVIAVPPQYTSQKCPVCLTISSENRKTQSKFKCIECSYQDNADLVAAYNILAAGHAVIACGEIDTSQLIETGTL